MIEKGVGGASWLVSYYSELFFINKIFINHIKEK